MKPLIWDSHGVDCRNEPLEPGLLHAIADLPMIERQPMPAARLYGELLLHMLDKGS